jgi:hypothetical protein
VSINEQEIQDPNRFGGAAGRGRRRGSRSGTTLLEVVIGASVITVLLGVLSAATLSAERAQAQSATLRDLETRARRAVDRIAIELGGAGRAGLVPQPVAPLGSSTLAYQLNEGWTGSGVQWSAQTRIAHSPSPGDPGFGLDRDGDGIVDAGRVVWVRNEGLPDERSVVWVQGVSELAEGELANGEDDNGNGLIDERGLSFELAGDTLRIRLTLEHIEPDGRRILRTIESAVGLRN